jgi:hypothetical protein
MVQGAGQYFRATGEIGGINAGAKRMLGLGNPHRGGPPGKITAFAKPGVCCGPIRLSIFIKN